MYDNLKRKLAIVKRIKFNFVWERGIGKRPNYSMTSD